MKMQVIVALAFGWLTVTAAIIKEQHIRINGENGWYVPQENGSLVWIDMDEAEFKLEARNIFADWFNPVKFVLYTQLNRDFGEVITASSHDIEASNFNPALPTRILIHGWQGSFISEMEETIKDAWLSSGDYNIICVLWSRARSIFYIDSVWAVSGVGKQVANLIDFLASNHKISLDTLYIIGYSLGAHISGYAGKYIKTGKVNTIIGLDPALPLFRYDRPSKRLSSTDARFVEVIHTSGGKLGFLNPLGTADFYPNGGEYQPNCPFDFAGICAHTRCVAYYAEAVVRNNFAAITCKSYEDAVAKSCGDTFSLVRMDSGANAPLANGSYYVPIKEEPPFGVLPV